MAGLNGAIDNDSSGKVCGIAPGQWRAALLKLDRFRGCPASSIPTRRGLSWKRRKASLFKGLRPLTHGA